MTLVGGGHCEWSMVIGALNPSHIGYKVEALSIEVFDIFLINAMPLSVIYWNNPQLPCMKQTIADFLRPINRVP